MISSSRRALVCLPLLIAGVGLASAEAARPRRQPRPQVRFTAKSVTPKTARAGATLAASVKLVATGGATVSQVSLRLVRAGAAPGFQAMEQGSGGRWTRRFPVPANYGKKPVFVSVFADAQTSLGARSIKVGQVKVMPTPLDPNAPPPPPPI